MKRIFILSVLLLAMVLGVSAQRKTDQLDRGLVAIKTNSGVFCSWRILGEEYYDVKYNLYRDGVKIAEGLNVSNYTDAAGSVGSKYTVKSVVLGQEQEASKEAVVWSQNYLEITPDHGSLKSTYIPNDACCADVDGDGELEILLKFDNSSWAGTSYQKAGYNGEYFIMEVYKLNGKKLWWIDWGPNMADFQNNEQNIVAYDWDGDGKAEAVLRASDGTVIHMADGTTQVIGDASKNYLGATNTSQWFVHQGDEYLLYLNGETGKPYQIMEYPLKRLESDETDLNAAWGDGYGHRSTKHFFGAPYLDGRKPSIFLARGIYTRHKMIALDVDPETHELTERWRWNCNNSSSPWYGNGYHNFAVVDVDWDGRDEICFGSMVIDDNGHGLSTTGLGHGDAQHHGDFNPYVHGQEIFAAMEDHPGNNYRDATTSKIYYRFMAGDDDGRAMMGNFTNEYPGCQGVSSRDPNLIGSVINGALPGGTKDNITQNFRIYWDGDLLDETQDYSDGKNTAIAIYKYGRGEIDRLTGSMTNNDTKGTPCYQGDLFGDWREEVITRTKANTIRIYTTTIPTEWRNYTLWHDMQYRNAMVWQMCGYNQPPHVSYFLGELEGITMAPPALTMTDRTEVKNGGSIDASYSDKQVILCETGNASVRVDEGVKPYIFFDNAPSWVQGHDNNDNIEYTYYTHTLTGGAFSGEMRLVKQGDGALTLPNVTQTYTGNTDIWAGTLNFDGTMQNSRVWLNRFAELNSNGGKFQKGIQMDYASIMRPGGKNNIGTLETTALQLNFGSRIVFDFADGSVDLVKAAELQIEKKDWENGPKYSTPVFEIVSQGQFSGGKYLLVDAGNIVGNVEDIIIEGLDGLKASLSAEGGKIYLNVVIQRDATAVVWKGSENNGVWDFANTANFISADGQKEIFVTNDDVTFSDNAVNTDVVIEGDVSPKSIVFNNNEKNYTLSGTGSIIGNASLTKKGAGKVTISNTNKLTGGAVIEGGTVTVSALANADGAEFGALGGVGNLITLRNGGTLDIAETIVTSQNIAIGNGGATINVASNKTLTTNSTVSSNKGVRLEKVGNGTLAFGGSAKYGVLVITQGTVQGNEISDLHQYPDTIVLAGGTVKDPDNIYSYSTNRTNIVVPEGKKGNWVLDGRCNYTGKLLGKGELAITVTNVRSNMQGDWSQFEGTITFKKRKTGSYDPSLEWNNNYGMPKATVTGEFENNNKNISFGTLTGNVTIHGTGRTTTKILDAKITKGRGGITNSYVLLDGWLEVETINVTIQGTGFKNGDEFLLWTAGGFSGSSATVNLPALPSGLYWDTSDLLKKDGKLRITNTPTGIRNVQMNGTNDKIYTLDGFLVSEPLKAGIYIKNGKKIIVK